MNTTEPVFVYRTSTENDMTKDHENGDFKSM